MELIFNPHVSTHCTPPNFLRRLVDKGKSLMLTQMGSSLEEIRNTHKTNKKVMHDCVIRHRFVA